jgi:predicted ABC-type sugar transport system permease subunit
MAPLAVFLGRLLRGMPVAFIGVPPLIATATLWEELEGGRFGARPMAGPAPP